MIRHRLALRQQMMLANNHPFLHSQSALLDRLNQPDRVFKTDQCIRVHRRDQGRLHADMSFRHAADQIHPDQAAELILSKQC